MAKEIRVDVKENKILEMDASLLSMLLKDNSSGKNLIWATDNYAQKGFGYGKNDHIDVYAITGANGNLIKPRTEKGVRCSKYYSTSWQTELPSVFVPSWVATIDDIYTAIIDELIPITAREGEQTKDFVDRYETILRLHKEIAKMQALVDAEKQAKKRFELNAKLKELQKELSTYDA